MAPDLRAKRHRQSLDLVLKRFIGHDPYRVDGEVIREPDGFYYVFNARVHRQIPDTVPLLIGDVCNNLRAALEHALWQLCAVDPNRYVYYPIFSTEEAFLNHGRINIREIAERYQTVIESLQPYNTGSDALSILRLLNDADKHKAIPVIGAAANPIIVNVQGARIIVPPEGELLIPVPSIVQIVEGAELIRLPLGQHRPQNRIQVNCRFEIRIVFGESPDIALAQRRPIAQTLQAISGQVENVLDALESA